MEDSFGWIIGIIVFIGVVYVAVKAPSNNYTYRLEDNNNFFRNKRKQRVYIDEVDILYPIKSSEVIKKEGEISEREGTGRGST